MPDRVGFEVYLKGEKQVMASLREIQSEMRSIRQGRLELQFDNVRIRRKIEEIKSQIRGLERQRLTLLPDTSSIDAQIRKIKGEIASFREEKIHLDIDAQNAQRQISSIKNTLRNLESFRLTLKDDDSRIGNIDSQINKLNDELTIMSNKYQEASTKAQQFGNKIKEANNQVEKLNNQKIEMKENASPELKKLEADLDNLNKKKAELNATLSSNNIGMAEASADLGKASLEADNLKAHLQGVEEKAKAIEGVFSSIAGGISTIGGILQKGSQIFGGRIVETGKSMAGAFGMMGAYSAVEGTIKRYDTMRIFPKQMEMLNYNADEAKETIDDLEEAVLGLPTGLNEIVESASQLIPLTGDLKKGANLAIATNNAFLAGGADAQAVNYAQRQIKDILSKGKLTEREWNSIFTGLGSGLGVIAEQMGYKGVPAKRTKMLTEQNDQIKTLQSRLKSLRDKKYQYDIEGETKKSAKWAEKIEKVNTALSKLEKKQYKDLGAFRNALQSGEIDATDFLEALVDVGTGKGELAKRAAVYKDTLTATGQNIKNAVQRLGEAGLDELDRILTSTTGKDLPNTIIEISDAIKHKLTPALRNWLEDNSDKIGDFIDRIKNYDWFDLISRVGKGIAKYYDILSKFYTKVGPSIVSFMAVWAGPLGRALGAVSGVVSVFGKAIGFLVRNLSKIGTTRAVGKGIGVIKDLTSSVPKLATKGSLKSAFGGLGVTAGVLGNFALLGGVIAEYAKVIELISNIKIGSDYKKNVQALVSFSSAMALIAAPLTILNSVFSGVFKPFAPAVGAGEAVTAGFFAVMGLLAAVVGEYATVIDKIGRMKAPSEEKFTAFRKSIGSVIATIKDIPKLPFRMTSKMDKLADATESMVGIAKGLKNIRAVGNIGNMSNRMSNIMKAIDAIMDSGIDKIDNKKAEIIAKNLEQFEGSTSSISNIAQSFMDFRKTTKDLNKSIIETYTTRAKIITKAVNGVIKGFEFKTKEREMQKTNLEAMSGSVSAISSIASSLVQAKKDLKSITHKSGGGFDTTMGERVKAVVNSLYEPLGIFSSGLDDRYYDFTLADKNIQAFSKSITAIKNAFKTLNSIRGITRGLLPNIDQGNQKGGLSGLLTGGAGQLKSYASSPFGRLAERMKFILESLANAFNNINIDVDSGISEKITAIKDAITPLKETVDLLKQMQDPISKLGISKKGGWTLGDNIGTIISSLTGSFTGLADKDFVNLSENAKNVYNSVSYLSKMMTSLTSIRDTLKGFSFADGGWVTGKKLALVIGSLTGVFNGISATGEPMDSQLGNAAANLEAIATQLQAIANNAGGAAGALSNATGSLKKLGKAAENNKDAVSDFADAVGDLKSNTSGIGGKAAAAAGGIAILGWSASNQIDNLNNAADAAGNLASAINNIPSNKTVTISVNKPKSGIASAIGEVVDKIKKNKNHQSHGGLIYRAGGGAVLFKPRGTDTVPAMLTPGEFVTRKRAVNYFGTEFMRRVNNLDVDGALKALSIRAGSRVRSGYHVTNNYTRDNHATATFNINRASQGYSQRFASRWVRSLV